MLNTEFDGRFRIESELAKNNRAWIYRGTDLATGQKVAIKVLRPWTAPSEKLDARFDQEFKLLRTLQHPNIVQVIQTGLTPNRFHYFAMELLKGQTLAQKLAEIGPLPPSKVVEYLDQIAPALDTAHARSVVHRDINPGNIMLHRGMGLGVRETVKILDFGLAKIVSESQGPQSAELTAAGVSVGTPAYMSPEQAMGGEITPHSDIYSLGVTLYHVLGGKLPYEKPTDYATMVAHVAEPIPWISDRGGMAVARPIEEVVRWAMSKEPSARPESAAELAKRFRAAVEQAGADPVAGAAPIIGGQPSGAGATGALPGGPKPALAAMAQAIPSPAPASAGAGGLAAASAYLIPLLVLAGIGLFAAVVFLALR